MLVSGDRKKGASNEAKLLGLPVELIEESETFATVDYIYPDCVKPVKIFRRSITQWRMAYGGPYGLDYNIVFKFMDKLVSDSEWDLILDDIQLMESAALKVFNEKKGSK